MFNWTTKPSPKIGDTRVITKFAWFPCRIFNEETNLNDCKWFQVITVKQEYCTYLELTENVPAPEEYWANVEFVEKE